MQNKPNVFCFWKHGFPKGGEGGGGPTLGKNSQKIPFFLGGERPLVLLHLRKPIACPWKQMESYVTPVSFAWACLLCFWLLTILLSLWWWQFLQSLLCVETDPYAKKRWWTFKKSFVGERLTWFLIWKRASRIWLEVCRSLLWGCMSPWTGVKICAGGALP